MEKHTMSAFYVGQRVDRIEDREITGAIILTIVEGDEGLIELQYDEGGTGWWPSSAIKPRDSE